MNFREGFEGRTIKHNVEDYEDAPYYKLLRTLPSEIASRCINEIEARDLDDSEAADYLHELIERRKEATTESVVSDEYVENLFKGQEEEIYNDIETTVFTDNKNHLGKGQTARVKSYEIKKDEEVLKTAIKYVVTPSKKTLTASGEHDVIREVERIEKIEEMESSHLDRSKYIRVPHPYFHHRTDRIQCYGMELIDGANLQEIIDGTIQPTVEDKLRESPLLHVNRNELFGYVERFFNTMHEYCLHGDIKPKNIMLSTEGVLYIIDFGQSVLTNEMTDKTSDQFDVLMDDEIAGTKRSITLALNTLRGIE